MPVEEKAPLFIADVHLGKLAKALRLLGFDTVYSNAFTPAVLLRLAGAESRVLLSRSAGLTAHTEVLNLHIQSPDPEVQLCEVVHRFQLYQTFRPFTRCLICNGQLSTVPKETIRDQLEPNTATYYEEFWQCELCRRVYWKGAHYHRMHALITVAKGAAPKP
jgi:uncharacterized protein with PIN domain